MTRFVVVLLFLPVIGFSQIRMSRLEVEAGQIYRIGEGDIIVVDTLVLRDSSIIELNRGKKDNFIHARHLVAGKGARISGNGSKGKKGKDGAPGTTLDGPCIDGTAGQNGTAGTQGESAVNLFLYLHELNITGSLQIDLGGSDGGDGGNGGNGGGGSPGTRVCQGGTGGVGGNGGNGGGGGNGGTLTISCKECPELRTWLGEKLVVRNYAGFGGIGGDGGGGGLAGLGALGLTSRDGKGGARGKKGQDGEPGKPGAINFERN